MLDVLLLCCTIYRKSKNYALCAMFLQLILCLMHWVTKEILVESLELVGKLNTIQSYHAMYFSKKY